MKTTNDEHTHSLSGWRFKAMVATVILAMIGYALFSLWGGWSGVVDAAYKVGFKGIGIALSLSLLNYTFRFIRWQTFLRTLNHPNIPWKENLKIYIAGFALTATPGKAGEAFRGVFLKDYGVTYRKSFGAFLAERFSDLISVVILALGGLWFYPSAHLPVIFTAIFIIILLYAVQKDAWLQKIELLAQKILPDSFSHIPRFCIETILAFRSCFQTKVLLFGIFMGMLAWGAESVAFYYLLSLLDITSIGILTAIFIYSFSLLVGALTFLPGGLGGAEVAMLQLLLLNDVEPSTAVAVTIVIRFCTLWFSIVLGVITMSKLHLVSSVQDGKAMQDLPSSTDESRCKLTTKKPPL